MRMIAENEPVEWDLSDLYSGIDDPKFAADYAANLARARQFEEHFKGRIAADNCTVETLRAALAEYDAILRQSARPATYAQLMFEADATDEGRGALMQRTQVETTAVNKHLLFFDLELGSMPQQVFDRLIADPRLGDHRHYVEYQRLVATHNL